MAKKYDQHSMAEDYLAQAEWESNHPFDKRGRPSAKYQPKWKYERIFPKPYKMPTLLWIVIIILAAVPLGVLFLLTNKDYPGVGIVAVITVLSTIILFYFLTRPSKKK